MTRTRLMAIELSEEEIELQMAANGIASLVMMRATQIVDSDIFEGKNKFLLMMAMRMMIGKEDEWINYGMKFANTLEIYKRNKGI